MDWARRPLEQAGVVGRVFGDQQHRLGKPGIAQLLVDQGRELQVEVIFVRTARARGARLARRVPDIDDDAERLAVAGRIARGVALGGDCGRLAGGVAVGGCGRRRLGDCFNSGRGRPGHLDRARFGRLAEHRDGLRADECACGQQNLGTRKRRDTSHEVPQPPAPGSPQGRRLGSQNGPFPWLFGGVRRPQPVDDRGNRGFRALCLIFQ